MLVPRVVVCIAVLLFVAGVSRAQVVPYATVRGIEASAAELSGEQHTRHGAMVERARSGLVRMFRVQGANSAFRSLRPDVRLGLLTGMTFETRGTTYLSEGRLLWVGNVAGSEVLTTLVISGNELLGRIAFPGREIQLAPLGNGITAIFEAGPDDDGVREALPLETNDQSLQGFGVASKSADSGGPSGIDLMVVYTPAAAAAVPNISSTISLAVQQLNNALSFNFIPTVVSTVHTAQVEYVETGSAQDALDAMADGSIPGLSDLRSRYRSDFVVMLTSNNINALGKSAAIRATSPLSANAVVRATNAEASLTLAHEVGHLAGGVHDKESGGPGYDPEDPPNGRPPYSHGFTNISGDFKTIMSIWDRGTKVEVWSSAERLYGGLSTGSSAYENVERVWREEANGLASLSNLLPPWNPDPPLAVEINGPTELGFKQSTVLSAWAYWDDPSEPEPPQCTTCSYYWEERFPGGTWVPSGVTTQNIYVTMTSTQGYEYKVTVASGSKSATDTHFISYCASGCGGSAAAKTAPIVDDGSGNGDRPTPAIKVSVSPHPVLGTTAHVWVESTTNAPADLRIYDMTGREVASARIASVWGKVYVPVDVTGLPPALYLYRVQAGSQIITGSVIRR